MNKIAFKKILISTLLTQVFFGTAFGNDQNVELNSWGAYLKLDTERSSDGDSGSEAMAFIPVSQVKGDSILFVDLRGVIGSGAGAKNISFGMGYRKVINDNFIVGVNAAIDKRQSANGQEHTQRQVGVEILTEKLAVALNFYMPLSGEELIGYSESYVGRLDGNQAYIDALTRSVYEKGLAGTYINFSYEFDSVDGTDFSFDGSAYRFGSGSDRIEGVRASLRAERDMSHDNLDYTLGGYVGLRRENGNNSADIGTYVTFYTGNNGRSNYVESLNSYEEPTWRLRERLLDPVKRSSAIQTGQSVEYGNYTAPATITVDEKTYDQITATIDNSEELFDTVTSAGNNTLVVLDGERGNFILNEALELGDDQSVVGGSTPVLLTGPDGQQAIVILPGESAVVVSTEEDRIVITDSSQLINVDELIISGPVSNTEIINGSFEDGHDLRPNRWGVFSEIIGWTAGSGLIEIQRRGEDVASEGESFMELDSHRMNSNSEVYQDIETVEGETFRLSFDYAVLRNAPNADSNAVEVYWEGELIATVDGENRTDWVTNDQFVTVNSNTGSSRLEFRAAGVEDTYGGYIDNVKLEYID